MEYSFKSLDVCIGVLFWSICLAGEWKLETSIYYILNFPSHLKTFVQTERVTRLKGIPVEWQIAMFIYKPLRGEYVTVVLCHNAIIYFSVQQGNK